MAIDPKRVADKLRHKLKRNFRGTQAFWFAVIEELFSEIEEEFGTGAGGNTAHVTRRQLIHLADGEGGPWEEFDGAYKEVLPAADPFPTTITWWTDSGKTIKVVEKSITRNASQMPTTIAWTVYNESGVALRTITEAITYVDNIYETERTRTIT